MINNKIKMLMSYRNVKQMDLIEVLEMSTKQSISKKFSNNSFNVKDLIKISDLCGCNVIIQDKETLEPIVKFDMSDLRDSYN